jgi:RHS repeat-associated protein
VGALSVSYTYDNNGNVLTMTDGTGVTEREYDAFNRTISKTVPNIGESIYDYDFEMAAGCTRETTTDPKLNVTLRAYDPVGRLCTVTANGMTSTYTYNDNGSLATLLYGNGSREVYTYTVDNLLQTLTNRKADDTIIDAYAYTYDAAHNLLTKTDSRGTTTYTYDVLNRLASVTEPSGKVTTYTYDESGNRLTQTVVGTDTNITTTTYSYNTLNRLTGTVTTLTDGNTLVTVTTEEVEYEYDFNGNQLTKKSTAYIGGIEQEQVTDLTNLYDLFNQLIQTITSDGITVSNTYNGDGLRVGKSVRTSPTEETLTRYLYEYQRVVLEVNSLGDQTGRNVYGINLLTRQVGGDILIYMYNGHADVTALLSTTTGEFVATYYYDAFGNILDQTGTASNNILYAGYQYDTETGLYYLNARMYDPVTARFMQEDTYTGDRNDPLSLNLYTYCHNEPLMYSDPTGHYEGGYDPYGYARFGVIEAVQTKNRAQQKYDIENNTTHYRPDWACEGGEAPYSAQPATVSKNSISQTNLDDLPITFLDRMISGESISSILNSTLTNAAIMQYQIYMNTKIDPKTVEPSLHGYLDHGVTKTYTDSYNRGKNIITNSVDEYWDNQESKYNLENNVLFQYSKFLNKSAVGAWLGACDVFSNTAVSIVELNPVVNVVVVTHSTIDRVQNPEECKYLTEQYFDSYETMQADPWGEASKFYTSIGKEVVDTFKDPYRLGNLYGQVTTTALLFSLGNGNKSPVQKGYHATNPQYAQSITQNGFIESTTGRAGGSGVYVNNTPEGAIAEYAHYYPYGPNPTIISVEYSPQVNVMINNPGPHIQGPLSIFGDTLSFESTQLPGTYNTIIRNGSIKIVGTVQ